MGFLHEKWAEIVDIGAAITANPGLFAIIFLLFAPFIWLKWRAIRNGTQKATSDLTHGLRARADTKTVNHDSGIGTSEVLVMRPNRLGAGIWFGVFFFGSGAVFLGLFVLPTEPTSELWFSFTVCVGFCVLSVFLIGANQTRIYVDALGLERRTILGKRQRIEFNAIAQADLNTKAAVPKITIWSTSGQTLRVTAQFSGFVELIARLGKRDPKLAAMAQLLARGR